MLKIPHLPFWMFTIAISLGLTLPILLQDGMFCDAYLYTSVSHNMALGQGTFWFPYFDEKNVADMSSFHEQPPLVFWLQSLFFTLLGDSLYTERIYTILTLFLNGFLIHKIWTTLFYANEKIARLSWLPIICWITIPVCFWSYSNCMHENTMSVFCLLSIWIFALCYYTKKSPFVYLPLSGMMVCMAFLCKGFPGLYPLAFPGLIFILGKSTIKKTIQHYTLVFIPIIVLSAFIYLNPDAHQSIITNYLQKRAFQRIQYWHTVNSQFDIFFRLISELIALIGLTLMTYFIYRRKKEKGNFFSFPKETLLLLLLGLCGTLPLMLTSVQKGFYMVAALPCFGLCFASVVGPHLSTWVDHISITTQTRLRYGSMVLLMLVMIYSFLQVGKTSRDKDILNDVYVAGTIIPKFSFIEIQDKKTFEDWSFQNYLMRYLNITLRWKDAPYLLTTKGQKPHSANQYNRINVATVKYDFYVKSTQIGTTH